MEHAVTKAPDRVQNEKWDLLRALLIFLVVLLCLADSFSDSSKSLQAFTLLVDSFLFPCLLFLEGLLGKQNIREKKYRQIFSYVFIYLFSKILFSLVSGVIDHSISFSLLSESGAPWYSLCLFWCSLLTIFLSRFPKRWVLIFSVAAALMAGYDANLGDMLVLSRTIVFFPFFFAGYLMEPEQVAERISTAKIRVFAVLFLAAFFAVCLLWTDSLSFLRVFFTGREPYEALCRYEMEEAVFSGGLIRLLCYVISALGCISVMALIPNHLPHSKAILAAGRRCHEIYMLHRPTVYILCQGFSLPTRLMTAGIGGWIIFPLAAAVTAFLALPFFEKPIHAIVHPKVLS